MPELECPICKKRIAYTWQAEVPWRPFCSDRCKAIDLHRWLTGEYRISEELPEPSGTGDQELGEDRWGPARGPGP